MGPWRPGDRTLTSAVPNAGGRFSLIEPGQHSRRPTSNTRGTRDRGKPGCSNWRRACGSSGDRSGASRRNAEEGALSPLSPSEVWVRGRSDPYEGAFLGADLLQCRRDDAPERIRTADALLRTEALYPLSYGGRRPDYTGPPPGATGGWGRRPAGAVTEAQRRGRHGPPGGRLSGGCRSRPAAPRGCGGRAVNPYGTPQ
jgi:hypothetical protein